MRERLDPDSLKFQPKSDAELVSNVHFDHDTDSLEPKRTRPSPNRSSISNDITQRLLALKDDQNRKYQSKIEPNSRRERAPGQSSDYQGKYRRIYQLQKENKQNNKQSSRDFKERRIQSRLYKLQGDIENKDLQRKVSRIQLEERRSFRKEPSKEVDKAYSPNAYLRNRYPAQHQSSQNKLIYESKYNNYQQNKEPGKYSYADQRLFNYYKGSNSRSKYASNKENVQVSRPRAERYQDRRGKPDGVSERRSKQSRYEKRQNNYDKLAAHIQPRYERYQNKHQKRYQYKYQPYDKAKQAATRPYYARPQRDLEPQTFSRPTRFSSEGTREFVYDYSRKAKSPTQTTKVQCQRRFKSSIKPLQTEYKS